MTTKDANLSNFELVTIAVVLLDGDRKFIDQEDVALKVNNIAPGKFNWRKYPDRIDLGAVRYALQDAKKQKTGAYLIGSSAQGWMLSPNGRRWINELDLDSLKLIRIDEHRRQSIGSALEAERERLQRTKAYHLYSTGRVAEITLQEFYNFTRTDEYFQKKATLRRYTIIENAVSGSEELTEMWKYLQDRFMEGK